MSEKKPEAETEVVCCRLPMDVIQKIERIAAVEERTKSKVIIRLLRKALGMRAA